MDRYRSRPTWLYGYSTDAHSVRPGRTDMAQANLATPQLHTVSIQDGQISLKANMAVWPQHRCTQCPSRTDRYGLRPTWLLKANMGVWPRQRCRKGPSRKEGYSSGQAGMF